VTNLKIISATPGPRTAEQILVLIETRATGITLRELSRSLNRPRSMIQVCLKQLISEGRVYVHKNKTGMNLIYYPNKTEVAPTKNNFQHSE